MIFTASAVDIKKLTGGIIMKNYLLLFGSALILTACGTSTDVEVSEEASSAAMATSESVPESIPAVSEEIVIAPVEEPAPQPDVSREFRNALGSAEDYLNYSSFSKQGLYDQLLYEGFPEDAAQYAIDNVATDWNQNALQTAVDYLDYSSFSYPGLYDQLVYEGYAAEQAQYALDNVTTDWNQNALQTAIDYLEYSSFSDQGLYDQLIYEGYTAEQAQYAMNNLPQ
jgi:SOS response regulatory protein OraA/RecX